jgi:hypothetical protein
VIRVMELTIGLICSCVPAVNVLIGRRKYPRSYYSSGRSTDKQMLNRKLEGTTIWRSQRTASLTNGTLETNEPPLTNIDAQLAMLARPNSTVVRDGSLEERMRAGKGKEEDLLKPIQRRNSVSSSTGRREGWLAEGKGESSYTDHDGNLRTVDISLELAKITRNSVWDRIWDGQRHTEGSKAPSSAHSAAHSVVDGDQCSQ